MGKLEEIVKHLGNIDFVSVEVGIASLALILMTQRLIPKVPGSLAAIVILTAVVSYLHLPVETIGSRFGDVPQGFPSPGMPDVTWSTITGMISPAITIALLGSIESLLSAVVADGMIRSKHRSNTELIAQGIANLVSPVFSGIPATGAIARTATNVRSGGRTPVAGIVHGLVVLSSILLFGKFASLIPMPVLAAILIIVAYNMSEWRSFRKILKYPKSDVAVMVTTFALTVFVDLTVAIQVGVILSAFLFIKRMADVSNVTQLTAAVKEDEETESSDAGVSGIPQGVEVFELQGSLFFGAVEQFTETIRAIEKPPKVFILEAKNLLAVDATGLRAIEDIYSMMKDQGTLMMISGIHKQPLFAMTNSGLYDKIGEDMIFGSLDEAIGKAEEMLGK